MIKKNNKTLMIKKNNKTLMKTKLLPYKIKSKLIPFSDQSIYKGEDHIGLIINFKSTNIFFFLYIVFIRKNIF